MIPGDGGGRRPLRQAPSLRSRRLCPHINGETGSRRYASDSTNLGVLEFSRSQCDGDHSQGPPNRVTERVWAQCAHRWFEIGSVARRDRHLGSCFPRFRARAGAKRGPHADLPQREEKSAAPALSSAGLGAALALLSPRSPQFLTGPETPYARGHWRGARSAGW
jgi:hypothetical protein